MEPCYQGCDLYAMWSLVKTRASCTCGVCMESCFQGRQAIYDVGSGKLELVVCVEPCSQGCHSMFHVGSGKEELVVCIAMYGVQFPGLCRVGSGMVMSGTLFPGLSFDMPCEVW